MDAIVLAAGRGARMAPCCSQSPKPLLPLAGRSLLHHLLRGLTEASIKRVVVVVEHMAEAVEAAAHAVGEKLGLDVVCVRQGDPKGTGHAVAVGAEHVSGDALVVVADGWVHEDTLKELANSSEFAVAVATVKDPHRYGVLDVDGDRVVGLQEKPERGAATSNTVNTGLYHMPADALAACANLKPSVRGELELTDVLADWAKEGKVQAVTAKDWYDVGNPWDYLGAHEVILPQEMGRLLVVNGHGGGGHVEPGVVVNGRLWVEPGATVRSGTYIDGDVYVAAGADVGPNAYLRGAVYLGPGARVGAASEIKNSILLDGAKAPHHNYVGDSVLGQNCNLGSGTKIANLKFSDATVRVDWDGFIVDTGRRKFGAVVGDGARTGINASLLPGTVIGAGAWVGAGKTVGSWIEAGAKLL